MIGRFQKVQTLLGCKTIPFLLPEMPDLRSPGNRALNKFNDVRRAARPTTVFRRRLLYRCFDRSQCRAALLLY